MWSARSFKYQRFSRGSIWMESIWEKCTLIWPSTLCWHCCPMPSSPTTRNVMISRRNLINTLFFGRPTSAPTLRTLTVGLGQVWYGNSKVCRGASGCGEGPISMWYCLAESGWGSTSHQRRETFHSLLIESIFSPPHVRVDSGYIISRQVNESHGGLWDELMAGLRRIRCLNYLDRRETAFKFFDVMASMCWMTKFWERLLGLGKRSWKRRLKGRKKFSRCKWPQSTHLSLTWTNLLFNQEIPRGLPSPSSI